METKKRRLDLAKIDFLDTKKALMFCGGDASLLQQGLAAFLEESVAAELQRCYAAKDWARYLPVLCELKGNAKLIGATQLSLMARELEVSVRRERLEDIHVNHAAVVGCYLDLMRLLRNVPESAEEVVESEYGEHSAEVLVVDDDQFSLRVAQRVLEPYFKVVCVKSGKEALRLVAQHQPDLILLDVYMQELDGIEVLKELKSRLRLREIPVVVCSADEEVETELTCLKIGACDYIRKPFMAEILLHRVNNAIEEDRIRQHLRRKLQRNTLRMDSLFTHALMALAQTIDAKDAYTKGHSTRVADYARLLAKKMGLPEDEQNRIHQMGLLHDIGKIGVPDYIINKTERLTDEEFDMIRVHPSVGYDILKNFKEIPGIELGARWHHERIDGSGYPDGLRGAEIPVFVRIISVADAYDAMTSVRSYRDILPRERILSELENGKGKQFDAEIAELMIQMVNNSEV